MTDDSVLKEIDNLHGLANEALILKQFGQYTSVFSDALQYTQLNGKTIGKEQIAKDIKSYFNRIQKFSSHYKRMDYKVDNQKVIETLAQHSSVSIRVFVFFSKKWVIEREGVYEWKKIDNSWQIVKVKILKEIVS